MNTEKSGIETGEGEVSRVEAWKYIRKIRNFEKKSFARKAYQHIFNDAAEPEWNNYDCSYMAKQSVCIHLRNIFEASLGTEQDCMRCEETFVSPMINEYCPKCSANMNRMDIGPTGKALAASFALDRGEKGNGAKYEQLFHNLG